MGASRFLVGIVCAGLFAGCADQSGEADSHDLDVAVSTEDAPNLPVPPPDSTCALIQRGTLGAVQDSDVGFGNGPNWTMGSYPFSWTGPSPYDHWSAFQFDMSVVPPDATVVLATFSVYASWNMDSSTVRAHRIKNAWSEPLVTWNNFGGNAAWDSSVLGSFDPNGVGFRSVDVTALAQAWHSGAVGNHGILLEEDPVKLHNYCQSEVSTVSRRPSLFVCWANVPPPACEPVGGACSADADCCDGIPCTDGTCHVQICGSAGAVCGADSDCCAGNVCNGGVCGLPAPVCSDPGQACGAGQPCCNGLCNEGFCPNVGGMGGGGQCLPVGDACGADADCCEGSCFDGMCVGTNQCLPIDAEGCDPTSPCCDGAHCIFGLCWNDGVCKKPGAACDPDSDSCCWGMACSDAGFCE